MIHKYYRRIYYGETDKMGVAYYANYLVWFEEARTEFFRDIGYPYTSVEDKKIFLPVIQANCNYYAPLTYDDAIEISTKIDIFKGVRIGFCYEIRKKGNKKVTATGATLHAFINEKRRPAKLPDVLIKVIKNTMKK